MKNWMKKLLTAIALGGSFALVQPTLAHGEKPSHGGVMAEAKDLSFELVSQNGKAVVYILDHGQPVDTSKTSGKLTVMNGAERSEVNLQPAGENRLESSVNVAFGKGAIAIASLNLADNKKVSVRFSVK